MQSGFGPTKAGCCRDCVRFGQAGTNKSGLGLLCCNPDREQSTKWPYLNTTQVTNQVAIAVERSYTYILKWKRSNRGIEMEGKQSWDGNGREASMGYT
jgi:hypothetical protein